MHMQFIHHIAKWMHLNAQMFAAKGTNHITTSTSAPSAPDDAPDVTPTCY